MKTVEPSEGVKNSTHDDEEIQWTIEPDKKAMIAKTILHSPLAMFLGVFIAPFTGAAGYFLIDSTTNTALVSGIAGLLLPTAFSILNSILIPFKTTQYCGTDERILEYRKFIHENTNSTLLKDIRDAEYSKSFIGRIFNVGTVNIDAGIQSANTVLQYVEEPAEVANKINKET